MVELQGRLADGTQPDRGRGCLALSAAPARATVCAAIVQTQTS